MSNVIDAKNLLFAPSVPANWLVTPSIIQDALDELASRVQPVTESTIDVFSMSDFPAPVAGVITLDVDTVYRIHATLFTADRFVIPAGSSNSFIGEVLLPFTSIVYLGAGTLFTSTENEFIFFDNMGIVNGGGGASVFSIDGDINNANAVVVLKNSAFAGWPTMGSLSNLSLFDNDNVAYFTCGGINLFNVLDIRYLVSVFDNGFNTTTTLIAVDADPDHDIVFEFSGVNVLTVPGSTETMFDFRPNTSDNSRYRVLNSSFAGGITIFSAGSIGAITAVADASSSGLITAFASDGSTGTTVTSAAHGLFDYQLITITGTTNYDGVYTVRNVTANTFDIYITFTVDDATGSWTADSVTVTSTAHGLLDGDGVLINDDIDYDGGSYVYNALANSFQVNRSFTATTTLTWDTGGLALLAVRLISSANNGVDSTRNVASAYITNNVNVTVITVINTFTNLNLNTMIQGTNTSQWRLVNATTGEIQYLGLDTFRGSLIVYLTAFSAGGAEQFSFRVIKNGLALPDDVRTSIEIGANRASSTINAPIVAVRGDLFRPQVENNDGTGNITIEHLTFATA